MNTIHVLIYGDAHIGKSTFAASMPVPNLVFMFDGYSKDAPYLSLPGTTVHDIAPNAWGTPQKQVFMGDQLYYHIEYYHDSETQAGSPEKIQATAFKRFLNRMTTINQEFHLWQTITLDSLTMFQIASRMYEKYILNPNAKNQMQWYGGQTDSVEEMLMVRFSGFPVNVCVIAHSKVDINDITKETQYGLSTSGRLVHTLASQYSDLYRMYLDRQGNRVLQTEPDYKWASQSSMGASNPCPPHYAALWPKA